MSNEKRERRVGTVSRGIRCPIIREGDDLAKIVADSVLEAAEYERRMSGTSWEAAPSA